MEYSSPRKQYAASVTGRHVSNKEEAKQLRRLQQKSGLTEAEIRAQKVYRVALAKARNRGGDGKNAFRLEMREFRKKAALELGTHINDPRVQKLAERKLQEFNCRYWRL